jgi:hypothetical protein
MRFWALTLVATVAASGALGKHSHGKHVKQAAQAPQTAAYRDPNGTWTVEASTTVGSCPPLIPSSLTLADNKISSGGGANVQVWGYFDEEGNIVARFTGEGEHVARFHGTLKGGKGSGAWSSSTDMCGGNWRAAQD